MQFQSLKEYHDQFFGSIEIGRYIIIHKDKDVVICINDAKKEFDHEYVNILRNIKFEDRLEYIKNLKSSRDSINKYYL